MEKKKKFFFSKEENVVMHVERIDQKQMTELVGGYKNQYAEPIPRPYTESTYVRKAQ